MKILGLFCLPSVSLFDLATGKEKKKKKIGPTALNLETLPEELKKNRAGKTWVSDHLLGPSKEENSIIIASALQLTYWTIKLLRNLMKQSHCF